MRKMQPVFWTFLGGLLIGILIPNLLKGYAWRINGTVDLILLEKCLQESDWGREYFAYLLREKGSILVLTMLLGISIFGVPAGLLETAALGFYVGAIPTAMFLIGGVKDFLLGVLCLFPHYLLYIPVMLLYGDTCVRMSRKCWNNHRFSGKEYRDYFLRMGVLFFLLILGILLESYINPVLLKYLTIKFKIF